MAQPPPHARWSPWSLRFRSGASERGFLAARAGRTAEAMFLGGSVLCFVVTVGFLIRTLQHSREAGDVGAALAQARVAAALAATDVLLCLLAIAAARTWRLLALLGPAGLERLFAVLMVYAHLHLVFKNQWYLARMRGREVPAAVEQDAAHFHADYMLRQLTLLSMSHMAGPVRWVAFLPCEAAAVLACGLPAAMLGCPVPPPIFCLDLLWIVVCSGFLSFGTRRMEYYERSAFAAMAAEKSLRAQLEHQLEHSVRFDHHVGLKQEHLSAASPSVVASASQQESTVTALIFNRLGDGDAQLEGSLEAVANLGFNEHWHINAAELDPVTNQAVGAGGFGVVLPAQFHGKLVAVKAPLGPSDGKALKKLPELANELRIFRHIRHPNVVMFYGACVEPKSGGVLLVLEYIAGVTLGSFVRKPLGDPSMAERCKVLDDVCCALRYLHSRTPCIVHGDIKGTNVMVDAAPRTGPSAKLLDFGLSRLLEGHAKPLGGTLRWMPPEAISMRAQPEPSADVFCFGRVVYLAMTGCPPLRGVAPQAIYEAVLAGRQLPLQWPEGPEVAPLLQECRQLCHECAQLDPAMRPPLKEVHARISAMGATGDGWQRLAKAHAAKSWAAEAAEPGATIWSAVRAARAAAENRAGVVPL